jgi:hypothetical protein
VIFAQRRKGGLLTRLKERGAAVMAVTAALARKEPGCVDVEQGKNYGQALAGIEINLYL